jgi:hypothetical protein
MRRSWVQSWRSEVDGDWVHAFGMKWTVDSEQWTVREFAWLRHGFFIHPIGSDGWGTGFACKWTVIVRVLRT